MPFTLFRFLLLLALLLLGRSALHAQSTSRPPGAPSLAASPDSVLDARYASANEVSELKAQLNTLLQAYDQLVTRYNTQSNRLLQLERTAAPTADRRRVLRASAMPGSY